MASQETPRLLFVHAHPDDETMNNGVTIARYVQQGAEVTVVTCTLGEEGEIIDDRWLGLAVDRADQLGGYRIGELTTALQHLGVPGPRFLGGAGRWRDSGMPGTPDRSHPKFVDADVDEAAGLLAAIIDELRPHVVATYDPDGGYGHPDHIQTHRVTTAAVAAASWRVPKFYWGVIGATAFRDGVNALSDSDVLADWIRPPADVVFGFTDDKITAVVEAPEHVAAKVDAIAAHATQMLVGPTRRAFTLSNKLVLPVLAAEHYVLVEGVAGPTDERGWETDLLGGLGFGR
ncbi:N-acetyl-1-D-myo-inositol-2-amino-2-deoxy-alpha-D-glucopyranoside deacetylase [Mycobacterium sp. shizuoka-1]|uniref:N-acetyl-1-D-myo-inositol-2-amino-2-deoxy-alpha- D-glucopyranoside deacetylase n=1 Tax=Mycobacterium sp. shizuoka-1 TaxID=2039281 RepID=UPI000C062F53|nr:N-acetyl-1-D-myo-inositol-2-amino-2-deoxy-alpha-D-glucopyranoside deacetylase [Mycobacterium sp. shizuoka-1]GAY15964.1 1D-myo-inositol 2-acetamido-2-deoxy-alpha-D-glucopyranoside deacetylase [Mycobacterium sp. shizuoka-1]